MHPVKKKQLHKHSLQKLLLETANSCSGRRFSWQKPWEICKRIQFQQISRLDACKSTKNEFFYRYFSKFLSLLFHFSEFKDYLFPGAPYDGCFFALYTKRKKFRQFFSCFDWKTCKTFNPIVKIINIKLGFIKTGALPNTLIFVIYRSKIKRCSGKNALLKL